MAYFTRAFLRENVQARTAGVLTESVIEERVRLAKSTQRISLEKSAKPPVIFDIFLSHSSIDKIDVDLMYLELVGRGYSVYLDRVIDPHLDPSNINRNTAEVLRHRMAQSRSLFVATSSNIPKSDWVPWELGFADGWNGKAAVLPVVADACGTWGGKTYFELYPEVHRSHQPRKPNDLLIQDGSAVHYWGNWIATPRTL